MKLNVGVLDVIGGMVVVDKVCCFVLYKVRELGVKFIFGFEEGYFEVFCYERGSVSSSGVL